MSALTGASILVVLVLALGLPIQARFEGPGSEPGRPAPAEREERRATDLRSVGAEPPAVPARAPGAAGALRARTPVVPFEREFSATVDVLAVTAADGAPVSGARVELRSWPFFDDTEPTVVSGRTDPSGRASLRAPLGTVEASAAHESDGVTYFDEARTRLVSSEASFVRLELAPADRLRGIVLDAYTREPIAGARVDGTTAVSSTDERGRFELAPWPTGIEAGLRVRADGYGQESARFRVEVDGSWRAPARFGWPEERGSDSPFLELHLVPERIIAGSLVGEGDLRVENGWARARGMLLVAEKVGQVDEASARADASGAFAIDGLRPDVSHTVWVGAEGRAPRRFVAAAGERLVDLGTVVLGPGASVSGRTVDAWGEPIGGVSLRVRSERGEGREIDSDPDGGTDLDRDGFAGPGAFSLEAVSDARGDFRLEGLPAGNLTLDALIGRSVEARRELWLEPDESLALAEPMVLDDEREASSGRIVTESAFPDGLTVRLSEPRVGPISRASVGPDGRFRIWGLRPGVVYALRIRHGETVLWQGAVSLESAPLRIEI